MSPKPPQEELREKLRAAIEKKFLKLVEQVKAGPGSLQEVAEEIGVRRQALSQYAKGSVPASDVLLAALLYWDWAITVETEAGRLRWCAVLGDTEKDSADTKREPMQLSLFEEENSRD
jgi:transcriptional regulator with XRE-family HTH domain